MKKKEEIIDGITVKYHANGVTVWSKGRVIDGKAEGYWRWFRIDGSIKRSGNFINGIPKGEWITYDEKGNIYKKTERK